MIASGIQPQLVVCASAATAAITIAEAGAAEAFGTEVIGMASVVGILLGFQWWQLQQASKREERLAQRVSKLEDEAHDKLIGLIERQLANAMKVDQCMVEMQELVRGLVTGQKAVHSFLQQMTDERPCLLKGDPRIQQILSEKRGHSADNH